MTTEATVAQALGEPNIASDLVTLGAGIVALIFIFGFLFLLIKEGVPAFKAGIASIIEVMDKMSNTLAALNKTMSETQAANTAALENIRQQVHSLEIKLNYHIDTASRIEEKVSTVHTNTSEIKERVRSCGIARDPSTRSRREDEI